MDRGPVPRAASGGEAVRKRAPRARGLRVKPRSGIWNVTGTVQAGGRSKRIRKSTELPARPEFRDAAEELRRSWEAAAVAELVHGVKPSVPVSVAAARFLEHRLKIEKPLGDRDARVLRQIDARFGNRKLSTITDDEWGEFVEAENRGNAPASKERFLNPLCAWLNWCRKKPRRWLADMPQFDREQQARKPKHRRARRVGELSHELVMMLIEEAAPHFGVQVLTEYVTGGRVSMLLYHARICDLLITPNRCQLAFQDSKNGDPVVSAMPPWVGPHFERYLAWRGAVRDREAALFITDKRQPYADTRGMWGGQNKTAWRGARRRVVLRLVRMAMLARRAGDIALWQRRRGEARLMAQVTQHWFRHRMATAILSASGNPRDAMEQAGWRDVRSVMGYTHDVPERRRQMIENLFLTGDDLTQAPPDIAQVTEKK